MEHCFWLWKASKEVALAAMTQNVNASDLIAFTLQCDKDILAVRQAGTGDPRTNAVTDVPDTATEDSGTKLASRSARRCAGATTPSARSTLDVLSQNGSGKLNKGEHATGETPRGERRETGARRTPTPTRHKRHTHTRKPKERAWLS